MRRSRAGAAQAGGLSLEQRLQRVEDTLAIQRVLVDYSATQDAHDYAGYAALFASNGEWVNGKNVYKGREAIQKMLVDLYGAPPPGYVNSESFHISSNPQIDVNGERAMVRSRQPAGDARTQWRADADAGRPLRGRVHPRNGQWKILRRVDTPVMPTAEEWMKFIRERKATH